MVFGISKLAAIHWSPLWSIWSPSHRLCRWLYVCPVNPALRKRPKYHFLTVILAEDGDKVLNNNNNKGKSLRKSNFEVIDLTEQNLQAGIADFLIAWPLFRRCKYFNADCWWLCDYSWDIWPKRSDKNDRIHEQHYCPCTFIGAFIRCFEGAQEVRRPPSSRRAGCWAARRNTRQPTRR